MKNLITATVLALLVAPTAVLAQSAFDGTWKIDAAKVQAPKKPFTSVIKDSVYHCTSCKPPYSVRADGQFHPVKGHPDFDMEAVNIMNERTVRYTKEKNGKVVDKGTVSVSPDGKTLTEHFTEITNGGPIMGKLTAMRVAKAPAGSHATSGSWRIQGYSNVSDKMLTTTFKVDGNTLHMSNGTGESFDAKLDGSDAPFHGSNTTTSIAVTKSGPRDMRMVGKYQGEPVRRQTFDVSRDGRTMHIVSQNLKNDTTMRFVAYKQSGMNDAAAGGMTSATAPDGKPKVGTYVSSRGNQSWTFTFRPDGTYSANENGKSGETETGTWNANGDSAYEVCLHPDDGPTRCYRQSKPAADGTWTATRIGGRPDDVSTIRRKD